MLNVFIIIIKTLLFYDKEFSFDRINLKYNPKYLKKNGLIHYWSFNSHIKDEIGQAHLFNGTKARFTFDRFNRPVSALSLRDGYYQIPPGNYFKTGEFSILAWVRPRSYAYFSRIVEFGNEQNNNIILMLSQTNTGQPDFGIYEGGFKYDIRGRNLTLDEWNHVAVTFGSQVSIYVDKVLQTSVSNTISFSNVTRYLNFIGKSNSPGNANADADIDELKLFDRVLNQAEINFEVNNDIY